MSLLVAVLVTGVAVVLAVVVLSVIECARQEKAGGSEWWR